MSLLERTSSRRGAMRRAGTAVLVSVAVFAAGCTVRPLYSDAPLTPGGASASQALASVSVKPVKTRYGQQVRNQLIFLLTGGNGQPASPAYEVDLSVVSLRETSTVTQTTSVNEPSAATMTIYATYTLTDTATRKPIGSGTRQIASQFDVPGQEFASYRAQIDAENRAAREVAELVRLAIAQDIARQGGS